MTETRIIINPRGEFIHREITDPHLINHLDSVLSFREIPSTVTYPISKYAPIGKYDIFTVSLETSHEGIKTPLRIGPKAFTAPLIAPLIDNFQDYLYAIANTLEDRERWKQYKEFKTPEENLLEKGFTLDYTEGALPQTLFKYERKFFERLDEIYENTILFSSITSTGAATAEEYFETLGEQAITLETDAIIPKKKPTIDADVIYNYPRFTVPVSINAWTVYITIGYDEYPRNIRQIFRTSLVTHAPIDFEIMLRNIKTVKKDLKKASKIIETAPDFYNPIKDAAKETLETFINHYTRLAPVAKEAKELKIFRPDREIKTSFDEYLQKTAEGYEIVVACHGECGENDLKRAEELENLIREKTRTVIALLW